MNGAERAELMRVAKIIYRDNPQTFTSLNHAFTTLRKEWLASLREQNQRHTNNVHTIPPVAAN